MYVAIILVAIDLNFEVPGPCLFFSYSNPGSVKHVMTQGYFKLPEFLAE